MRLNTTATGWYFDHFAMLYYLQRLDQRRTERHKDNVRKYLDYFARKYLLTDVTYE